MIMSNNGSIDTAPAHHQKRGGHSAAEAFSIHGHAMCRVQMLAPQSRVLQKPNHVSLITRPLTATSRTPPRFHPQGRRPPFMRFPSWHPPHTLPNMTKNPGSSCADFLLGRNCGSKPLVCTTCKSQEPESQPRSIAAGNGVKPTQILEQDMLKHRTQVGTCALRA